MPEPTYGGGLTYEQAVEVGVDTSTPDQPPTPPPPTPPEEDETEPTGGKPTPQYPTAAAKAGLPVTATPTGYVVGTPRTPSVEMPSDIEGMLPKGTTMSPALKAATTEVPKADSGKNVSQQLKPVIQGGKVDQAEISQWQADARALGKDPVAYSQMMWQVKYGISPADIAASNQVMPGVTWKNPDTGGIEPVPSPGTLVKRYDPETPTPYLEVYGERGQKVRIEHSKYFSLFKGTAKEQFDKFVKAGLISKDAEYLPGKTVYSGDWSYVPGELAVAQREFEKTHTNIKGDWYSNEYVSDLKRDAPELYKVLTTQGVEALRTEIDKRGAEYNKYQDALKRLGDYKLPATYSGGMTLEQAEEFKTKPAKDEDAYDLTRYLYDNPSDKGILVAAGYRAGDIEKLSQAVEAVRPYTDPKADNPLGTMDLYTMLLVGDVDNDTLATFYREKDINEMRSVIAPVKDAYETLFGKDYSRLEPILAKYSGKEKLSDAERNKLASELVGAITEPVKGASPIDKMKLVVAQQEAFLKIQAIQTPQYLAPAIKELSQDILEKTAEMPVAVRVPAEMFGGLAFGVAEAPLYTALFGASIMALPIVSDKGAYVSNLATGMWQYFKQIPSELEASPRFKAGELVGLFILGPRGAKKLASGTAARVDPYYIPNIAMRYSFSTGRIATTRGIIAEALRAGKITERAFFLAVERAQRRFVDGGGKLAARSRIGNSNIYINIEATPASKNLGAAFWHGTPDGTPYEGLKYVVENVKATEPAEFYALHSAPRFSMVSAGGVPAAKPAVVMLYTKKGIMTYPTSVEYAYQLATRETRGFNYLGSGRARPGAYSTIKTYYDKALRSQVLELESLIPKGMKIYRAQNFRSRILGAKAGEFITTYDGWIMPIYRFAEKGAEVPKAGLAKLTAIRLQSVVHAMRKALGKKGFKAAEEGYARVDKLAKELDAIGNAARRGLSKAAGDRAYRNAIDAEMVRRLVRAYRDNRTAVARVWRERPEAFERPYRESVNRELARIAGVRPSRTAEISRPEYVNARVDRGAQRQYLERALRDTARRQARLPAARRVARTSRVERTPRIERVPRVITELKEPKKYMRRKTGDGEGKDKGKYKGAITWKQGFVWYVIKAPYKTEYDIEVLRNPPSGAKKLDGPRSAYKTIQRLTGRVPKNLFIDMGIMDIQIKKPTGRGQKGAITFKRDIQQKTKSELSLKGVRSK